MQNEYTTWIGEDLHARAYEKLFGDPAVQIIERLGEKLQAHENSLCLACHTNPLAANKAAAEQDERLSGVGCEACHGGAARWLEPHSKPDWHGKPATTKADAGMTPPGDFAAYAERCMGCHVGAPAQEGVPLRDVNHDLVAAGHPRLAFEYSAYLANMPRHWSKKLEDETPDFAVNIWHQGQTVSAKAALLLLANRAQTASRPWPEFAEYDCFACHHDLASPSWRQSPEHYGSRKPGALPWGDWYLTMPRLLARSGPYAEPHTADLMDSLAREMEKPLPAREKVCSLAQAGAAKCENLGKNRTVKPSELSKWLGALAGNPHEAAESWEAAEQLHLALETLAQLRGNNAARRALAAFGEQLQFPAPAYDSPRNMNRARLLEQLEVIRKELDR
ncbi:MAG TPA: multiheme c-type cytochrome [Gemmataceae bacterium]|nr:multiheme c-type cytochrome [Gemmataceae bacterium]